MSAEQYNPKPEESQNIEKLIEHYLQERSVFDSFLKIMNEYVLSSSRLQPLIHSTRFRTKSETSLRDKLFRKLHSARAEQKEFDITRENLFTEINDLAAFRILHLQTRQIEELNPALLDLFEQWQCKLLEGPKARTWDLEFETYYRGLGFEVEMSPNMYTSIHYVIEANRRSQMTCEIQVRTLLEEVWGEVDHKVNYPKKSRSILCQDQIKVLARVTSGCNRLVDTIFRTHQELAEKEKVEPTTVQE